MAVLNELPFFYYSILVSDIKLKLESGSTAPSPLPQDSQSSHYESQT